MTALELTKKARAWAHRRVAGKNNYHNYKSMLLSEGYEYGWRAAVRELRRMTEEQTQDSAIKTFLEPIKDDGPADR